MTTRLAMILLITTFCILLSAVIPTALNAELKLASPFTDHMVLQRDMPIPVWGSASPGLTITVEFSGQTQSVNTDSSGKWRVDLEPLSASSTGKRMTVIAGKNQESIELSNIVVGEVWICSGQSNMQWKLDSVGNIKALKSTPGRIRSFQVPTTVALEEQDHCDSEWLVERPDSAVATAFAHYLEEYADVPIGILLTAWGSSSIEAWMPRDMTKTVPHFKTVMEEFDANQGNIQHIKNALNADGPPWDKKQNFFLRHQPNVLYNAMMKPLVPYACRGLVWYQGERNTGAIGGMPEGKWTARVAGMQLYGEILPKWIQHYRQMWGQPDMHFLIVMLPGFGKILDAGPEQTLESPDAQSWAWMRESQLKALELPNTGVVNTIDLGHPTNIHPKDKLPVGQRLALLAARDTFGHDRVAQGPVMESVIARGNYLVVDFKYAEGLKTTDGKAPTGFWISDDSGNWQEAEAIIKGTQIALSASNILNPRHIRYAFAGMPKVNLINTDNLPAYPFRTDQIEP
ncbi:MAG: sialate O-acetylesterase [Lentimonas sp.]